MTIIETERLRLRLWQPEDVAPFVQLNADPLVTQFLPGPITTDEARAMCARQNALYGEHGTCYFAATLRETAALIGFVGVKYLDIDRPFAPCYDVGWRLGSRWWGRGLATEGALAALRHGFDVVGLDEIVSFTVPANVRSRRVMERIGMVRDADGDFDHPALAAEHPLARHVLYRMNASQRGQTLRV